MALGAWWLIIAVGALWRRSVWREGSRAILAVQGDRGGQLRAVWSGYELRAEGLRVRWRGGLRGATTVIWPADGAKRRVAGWIGLEAVQQAETPQSDL